MRCTNDFCFNLPSAITLLLAFALPVGAGCQNSGSTHQPNADDGGESAIVSSGDSVLVVMVKKGDELIVKKEGRMATVRMLGIDAFDGTIDDPAMLAMHREAKRFLSEKLLNQNITVTFGKTVKDAHGRYLAYVDKDGVEFNKLLIEQGYVLVYNEFSFERELPYLMAEQKARRDSKGIWSDSRLAQKVFALRKDWANKRNTRDGAVPDYYLSWQLSDAGSDR
jgi:endonuclease YncB( thermonuclease family)